MFDDGKNKSNTPSKYRPSLNMEEKSQKTLQFCFYSRLCQFDDHLSDVSKVLKGFTLTWLLATFIGVGFMISSNASQVPMSRWFAICLVFVIGSFGIILLWSLDLGVYHRFWTSLFKEESKIEAILGPSIKARQSNIFSSDHALRILSQGTMYIGVISVMFICLTVSLLAEYFINRETLILALGISSALIGMSIVSIMRKIDIKLGNELKE